MQTPHITPIQQQAATQPQGSSAARGMFLHHEGTRRTAFVPEATGRIYLEEQSDHSVEINTTHLNIRIYLTYEEVVEKLAAFLNGETVDLLPYTGEKSRKLLEKEKKLPDQRINPEKYKEKPKSKKSWNPF